MITLIISLLLSIGQINSADEYYEATPQEQQEMNVFVHDIIPD